MFRRFSLFFLAFVFIFLIFSGQALAAADFATFYTSTYTVNKDASVLVKHEIRIKNLLSNLYVSEYTITIGSNRITSISASDNFGELPPLIESGPNYTKILIKFKEKVVGKDKENHLNLSYKTLDFAFINGQILELGIPSVTKKEELEDYNVNLIIPSSFGPPSFIQPKPSFEKPLGENNLYYFNKEGLIKFEGISAAFGEAQIFDFNLVYQMDNPEMSTAQTEIALPPDTPFQHVFYQQISPPPLKVRVDEDGNWLASYQIKPQEKLTINASGSAELFIREKEELKDPPLTEEQKAAYLTGQKYWEVDSKEIKELAEKLKTPQAIYNYLIKNFLYDYARLNSTSYQRLGAKEALENKNSLLCAEFSDLFVTLCRAAGIPSRELEGYAHTSNPKLRPLSLNQDILHAWAEYYDSRKNIWLPVDPTWGSTTGGVDFFNKLDLNHFVFVRHGLKSYLPYPAGSYNNGGKQKNLFIEFGRKKTRVIKAEISAQLPSLVIAGLPIRGKIYLKNTGEGAFHNQELVIKTNEEIKSLNPGVFPPLADYQTLLNLKTDWKKAQTYVIEITFNNQKEIYQINSLPLYLYFWQKIRSLNLKDLTSFIKKP